MEGLTFKAFATLFFVVTALAAAGHFTSQLSKLAKMAEKSQRRGLISIQSINRQLQ